MPRLIDADALINEFDQTFLGNNPRGVIRATIENAPTIEPERKKGKWRTVTKKSNLFDAYSCSECNGLVYGKTNFCPYCGCDNRGKQDDDNGTD